MPNITTLKEFLRVELVTAFIILYLLYSGLVAIYRLFLHPLAKFPGSNWAAVSRWYEFYWNIWHRGSLLFEVERLHKRYGPIVRTGPNELHINVPDFHHELFKVGSKYVKEKYHYDLFCMPKASTGIRDMREIRLRREALKPLFDRKNIMAHGETISLKMERLVAHLTDRGTALLQDALSCYTLDVISKITFSEDFNAIDYPKFEHPYLGVLHGSIMASWQTKLIPSIRIAAMTVEPYVKKYFTKALAQNATMRLLESVRVAIDNYLQRREGMKDRSLNAVDHLMSNNAARNWRIPDIETLNMEILGVLGGGTETSATAATIGIYKVLSNPAIRDRLERELREAFPDPKEVIPWQEFEKVPYLAAVVKETFRWASPVQGRLPRIVPEGGTVVEGYHIPAGTVVGVSAYLIHRNESIFPNGHEFVPERWLDPSSKSLERYFITFSKGVGQCPGMNLAYAELYAIYGTLFLRFNMELAEDTVPQQMEWTDNIVTVLNGPKLRVNFTPVQS